MSQAVLTIPLPVGRRVSLTLSAGWKAEMEGTPSIQRCHRGARSTRGRLERGISAVAAGPNDSERTAVTVNDNRDADELDLGTHSSSVELPTYLTCF